MAGELAHALHFSLSTVADEAERSRGSTFAGLSYDFIKTDPFSGHGGETHGGQGDHPDGGLP